MNLRQWLCAEPQRSKILRQLAGGAQYFDHHVDDVVDFVRHNPKLRECSRDSLIAAIAKAGSWGVKVGKDSAVLIARKVDGEVHAAAMLHYRAEMALLKHKLRLVRQIEARPIYANEHFKVHQGTKKLIEHHVESSIRLRGELVGGYAWAETSRRDLVIVTLDRADIDQIRIDHSEDWADGELDDIARWYVPKTCIHQLRREIGLPDDYIAKYADDFSRVAPSPAPAVILSEATAFPVDPRAPKAAA